MIKLGFIFLDGCKGYKARLIKTKPATHDILGEIPILPSHTTKPLITPYYYLSYSLTEPIIFTSAAERTETTRGKQQTKGTESSRKTQR